MKMSKIFKAVRVLTLILVGASLVGVIEYGFHFNTCFAFCLSVFESIVLTIMAKEREEEESYEDD